MDDMARRASAVARECHHGPMLGSPTRQVTDFACSECIAAALREVEAERDEIRDNWERSPEAQIGCVMQERDALATRLAVADQQAHADRLTIEDLLREREQAQARLARVEGALRNCAEYIHHRHKVNGRPSFEECQMSKCVDIRAAMTPDATKEGTHE